MNDAAVNDAAVNDAAVNDIVGTIRAGNEPAQGLKPRSELTARELLREVGAVLRMSEAEAAKLGDLPLDPAGRDEVLSTVTRLNREKGITVVMITQYMEEAVLADRVAVMARGKLIMEGTPREVFAEREMLRQHGLDAPAYMQLRDELVAAGIPLADLALTDEELAEEICRLYLKP